MIGYTRVENFSKTSEEISNEDKKSLETITQLLQEFEEYEHNYQSKENKKDHQSTEFKSQDFISSVVDLNYPRHYFKIKHIYKGTTDDVLQKFVAEIKEFDFFGIPSSFGLFNLMFYQRLSIYLTVYGENSSDIGLELKLRKKIFDNHFKTNSRAWNKIEPISDCKMYCAESNSRQKAVVFNLPTGTGKTITSLCAAATAMCDFDFQNRMLDKENIKYWFRDFHNIIPGSDVMIEYSKMESLDIRILPVTIINVQSTSLFSQWYFNLSSRLEDIAKFCQESIFRRTGIKKNVKVNLYPSRADGKLMIKLHSLSHLWSTNQKDSMDCEIAFVVTTDSNFLSFVERNNELYLKKRKLTETIGKRIIYCPTVFINDEPQTSSTQDKYSRVFSPLKLLLCATHGQFHTQNTAFAKMFRGNVHFKKGDTIENKIIAERDFYGYTLTSCLLSYSTLRLTCFEAITRGKMPKSIISFNPSVTSLYFKLQNEPPKMPKLWSFTNEALRESIMQKYFLSLEKYNNFLTELGKLENFLTICYELEQNISIYCVGCFNIVESEFGRTIRFCKKCLNCGICHNCLPKFSDTEFGCHFCDLEKDEILKSLLPSVGIDPEYTIQELLIPKDVEIFDINFFTNFYNDIRNGSDDIDTYFKFSEDQKILIKIEKSLKHLQTNLSKIFEANFPCSIKMYFTLTALVIANFRHLVIIKNDNTEVDKNLGFLKYTPFASNLLFFDGKKSSSIDVFSKAKRDTFCVLFVTVKDIVGIDLQNADAIINISNSGVLDTNQISGRLMRLGMDYRTRIIINFKILCLNLLSISI